MATCDLAKFHMVIAHFFVVLAIISHSKMIPFELEFLTFLRSMQSPHWAWRKKSSGQRKNVWAGCPEGNGRRASPTYTAKGYNSTREMKRGEKMFLLRPFSSSFLSSFFLESPILRAAYLPRRFVLLLQDMATGKLTGSFSTFQGSKSLLRHTRMTGLLGAIKL